MKYSFFDHIAAHSYSTVILALALAVFGFASMALRATPRKAVFRYRLLSLSKPWVLTIGSCGLALILFSHYLTNTDASEAVMYYFGGGKFCEGPGELFLSELLLTLGVFFVLSLFLTPSGKSLEISAQRVRLAFVICILFALMFLLLRANSFLALYVLLECYNMGLYVLIGTNCFREHGGYQFRWAEVALKYFIVSLISSFFLLLGIALIYFSLGTMDFSFLGLYLGGSPAGLELFAGQGLELGLAFFTLGLCLKLGLAPFHFWVGSIYDVLPGEVFVFLMLFPKFLFLAIFSLLLTKANLCVPAWDSLVYFFNFLGLLNVMAGSLGALNQRSVKRILIFSSISNFGYVFFGLAAQSGSAGFEAVQGYLMAYLLSNGLLVLLLWRKLGNGPWTLGALARSSGGSQALLAALLVNFMGFPLSLPFLGKYFIVLSLLAQNNYLGPLVILLGSVITVIYTFPLLKQVCFQRP